MCVTPPTESQYKEHFWNESFVQIAKESPIEVSNKVLKPEQEKEVKPSPVKKKARRPATSKVEVSPKKPTTKTRTTKSRTSATRASKTKDAS